MTLRAVALLSGGLDSMLAVRIVQEQGLEVEAINFQTHFACCRETAARAAVELGVRLTVVPEQDSYLDVIRRPRFGYGRGANPCVDCRIFMFQRARRFMDERGATVCLSGEVLGQRPMSQKRRDLLTIARHSGLDDRLLRPLSARLLPPTLAERQGQIDRDRLFAFSGRSRKGLIALARRFGIDGSRIPAPSTGCMLTQQSFAPRVLDLVRVQPRNSAWDFALLRVGRHFRVDAHTKIVVGRRESENFELLRLARRPGATACAVVHPENFSGPTALIAGPPNEAALDLAGGLILRFARHTDSDTPTAIVETALGRSSRCIARHADAEALATL